MDGITATVAIRKLERELNIETLRVLPIVAMTAHTAAEYEVKCEVAGMQVLLPSDLSLLKLLICRYLFVFSFQDFICKPIHRKELVQKMNRHALSLK